MIRQEKINSFHFKCLRRLLGITWKDKITNQKVLKRTVLTTMYSFLTQRSFRWLAYVYGRDEGRITKDLLYGEQASGKH